MKKKQKMFVIMDDIPVVVTKGDDYASVTLHGYNGRLDVTITREWEPGTENLPADKGELASTKKLIEALQEIVEYAEGF